MSITIVFELKNLSTSWDTFQRESTSKKKPTLCALFLWEGGWTCCSKSNYTFEIHKKITSFQEGVMPLL